MRAVAYGSWAAIGVMLAAVAGEAAGAYSLWRSVGEFGLAIAFAVAAFVGMLAWIRANDKERRESMKEVTLRLREVENFQRDQLLKTTMQATAAIERDHDATERNTEVLENLSQVIDLMRIRFNFRPCMALEALPDEDRRAILRVFEERLSAQNATAQVGPKEPPHAE